MKPSMILHVLLLGAIAAQAGASTARLREVHVVPIAAGHAPDASIGHTQREREAASHREGAVAPHYDGEPAPLMVYPSAGNIGEDVAVPYYVDLDPTAGRRDFNCTNFTFDGHSGHDPYIRSFAEQAIGFPVFAARDGVVVNVRDGEPDQNTSNNPALRSNYVTIQHSPAQQTEYVHLKRGSITVREGDFVYAGHQIGQIGSSGPSTAPHLHFEMRYQGDAVEPFSGPCRPGQYHFSENVAVTNGLTLIGSTFSNRSFADFPPAPHDDAPRTGTFVRGRQTIYFKADLANAGLSAQYRLRLDPPGSNGQFTVANGTLVLHESSRVSVWWGIDIDLNKTGDWMLTLDVDASSGRQTFSKPFRVVGSGSEVVNRPPNPIAAALEPAGLRAGEVPVCRVRGSLVADPDYDVVSYRYEWRLDGAVVRDVTTAARSDALARNFTIRSGRALSCTVTASDGRASAQPAVANATVAGATKRRAVR